MFCLCSTYFSTMLELRFDCARPRFWMYSCLCFDCAWHMLRLRSTYFFDSARLIFPLWSTYDSGCAQPMLRLWSTYFSANLLGLSFDCGRLIFRLCLTNAWTVLDLFFDSAQLILPLWSTYVSGCARPMLRLWSTFFSTKLLDLSFDCGRPMFPTDLDLNFDCFRPNLWL